MLLFFKLNKHILLLHTNNLWRTPWVTFLWLKTQNQTSKKNQKKHPRMAPTRPGGWLRLAWRGPWTGLGMEGEKDLSVKSYSPLAFCLTNRTTHHRGRKTKQKLSMHVHALQNILQKFHFLSFVWGLAVGVFFGFPVSCTHSHTICKLTGSQLARTRRFSNLRRSSC